MAAKAKKLYLYIALACFLGIVAIFVGDGYMGVHETIRVTAGEFEQVIEDDIWPDKFNSASVWAEWGDEVHFRYQIENRLFAGYSAALEVSLWQDQQKELDLLSQQLDIDPFGEATVEFTVDTAILTEPQQSAEYTIIIKRGDVERRIILYLSEKTPRLVPG